MLMKIRKEILAYYLVKKIFLAIGIAGGLCWLFIPFFSCDMNFIRDGAIANVLLAAGFLVVTYSNKRLDELSKEYKRIKEEKGN